MLINTYRYSTDTYQSLTDTSMLNHYLTGTYQYLINTYMIIFYLTDP